MRYDFHERFNISLDLNEARRRFANRIQNRVFNSFFTQVGREIQQPILLCVADEMGVEYERQIDLKTYTGLEFHRVLKALEAFHKAIPDPLQTILTEVIQETLSEAEVDLEIRWENGRFFPRGAKLLDEKLVNDPLYWLRELNYQSVLQPYSKGIEHFLQSTKRPDLLSDVITDMYESLEALAKIVTNREKDLAANAESFVKAVKASEAYKKILKEYIAYANNFRHGVADSTKKPSLSSAEVENFIYLTGTFIRLAIYKPIALA